MTKRIILPLDNLTCEESTRVMSITQGLVWGYKLRKQILEKGLNFAKRAKRFGNIMLDFKLYDIPSAMKESLLEHFYNDVDITTVHCSSCFKSPVGTGVAGVTILTSFKQKDFEEIYNQKDVDKLVKQMTKKALRNKYEYIVCPPISLPQIQDIKRIKKICPGIRPSWYSEKDDQVRISTPKFAIEHGADLLVIGRPILNQPTSEDMVEAIHKTNEEIEHA